MLNCKYILIITHKSSYYLLMGREKRELEIMLGFFQIKKFVEENKGNEVGQEVFVRKDT